MFPLFAEKRNIPAKRWLSIGLRCMHLVGISGLSGAYLFARPESEWATYLLLTWVSGVLLILKEIYLDALWLLQLRGQVIISKLIFLGGAMWLPVSDQFTFLLVIIVSGIIAHAPGNIRYYSVWHGAVITREALFSSYSKSSVKPAGESSLNNRKSESDSDR